MKRPNIIAIGLGKTPDLRDGQCRRPGGSIEFGS